MKKLLMYLAFFASISLMVSCGEDETCTDGIQNGTETGIDCGGEDCAPCPSCEDGVQNGNETGIDCGGDCPDCITSVEEDQANIQSVFDDLVMCSSDLKNSQAVDVLFRQFLNLSDGEVLNEDWLNDLTDDLEGVIDFDHIDDNSRLDLPYHAGSHIFDIPNQTWVKANDVMDRMIFRFPSSPEKIENNVELIFDKYEDKLVTIDGESIYLPTAIHASMNVDGEKVFEVDVTKITYADNADFEIPVEISARVLMAPVLMSVDVVRVSTTEYEMSMTIDDGGKCNIGVKAELEFTDDDIENWENDSFEKVRVEVNVGKLSIQTTGDVASLLAMDSPNEAAINSLLDLDVLFDDLKIADLEINEDMETVLIFYKDGTFEDTSVFYDGWWEDVKSVWTEFFDI